MVWMTLSSALNCVHFKVSMTSGNYWIFCPQDSSKSVGSEPNQAVKVLSEIQLSLYRA